MSGSRTYAPNYAPVSSTPRRRQYPDAEPPTPRTTRSAPSASRRFGPQDLVSPLPEAFPGRERESMASQRTERRQSRLFSAMAPLARTPARRRSDPPHLASPFHRPSVAPPRPFHQPMSPHEEIEEELEYLPAPPSPVHSRHGSQRSYRGFSAQGSRRGQHSPVPSQGGPPGPPDGPSDDGGHDSEHSDAYDTADDRPRVPSPDVGRDVPGDEKGERLMRAATLTIEEMGRYLQYLRFTTPMQQAPYAPPPLQLPAPRAVVRAPKLKDPDTFNGEDPAKLQSFMLQCGLHFAQRPTDFPSDDEKIIYVMSYLRGPAAEWFQAFFLSDTPAPWDGDLEAFFDELQNNFGPHDPVGDAEDKIENCRMRDTERIAMFIVRFNQLAALTRWDDAALAHRFYRGLPSRIKDELSRIEHPDSLVGIREAARRIDSRYWRREEERKRETSRLAAPTSARAPGRSPNGSNSSSPPSAAAPAAESTPKPHADKLGKDGKLRADERDRRLKEGLCLYCGGKGHQSKDCKKRPTVSGRASEVATTSDQEK